MKFVVEEKDLEDMTGDQAVLNFYHSLDEDFDWKASSVFEYLDEFSQGFSPAEINVCQSILNSHYKLGLCLINYDHEKNVMVKLNSYTEQENEFEKRVYLISFREHFDILLPKI